MCVCVYVCSLHNVGTTDQRNFTIDGQIRRISMSVDRKVHFIVYIYVYVDYI